MRPTSKGRGGAGKEREWKENGGRRGKEGAGHLLHGRLLTLAALSTNVKYKFKMQVYNNAS